MRTRPKAGWVETNPSVEWWNGSQGGSGSAHAVSGETPDYDPAEAVRKVAEEVSRKEMPRKPPFKFGFAP